MGPGRLHPWLQWLGRGGLREQGKGAAGPRARREYILTAEGREAFDGRRDEVWELHDER